MNSNTSFSKEAVLCPVVEGEGETSKRRRTEGEAEVGREEAPTEESEEVRQVTAPPVPVTPSRQEVLTHRLTHRPFRSWCPHCVRGKSREDRHHRSTQKDEFRGVPKVVSDYFFVGRKRPAAREERMQEEEEETQREGQTPILVIKDTASKALFAQWSSIAPQSTEGLL